MLEILGGILIAVVIVGGLFYLAYVALRPEQDEKSKDTKNLEQQERQKTKKNLFTILRDFFWQPIFFVLVGIIAINGLFWAIAPETWKYIRADQTRFWIINIGAWVGVCLLFVPKKDTEGKDQSERYAVARALSKIIFLGVVATIIVLTWKANPVFLFGDGRNNILSRTSASNLSHSVPMEVALRVIAECESGSKQFEEDGKTPLKNKGIPEKGVKPSSAFGKYQFLESHREPAKKLGFDLNTEEGQDGYARYRYSQTGTKDWEFDEQYGGGRVCWEPKLLALRGTREYRIDILAPVGEFGKEVSVIGYNFSWGKSEGVFVVKNESGVEAKFNPKEKIFENLPKLPVGFSRSIRFKSLSDKPETAVLELVRQ